MNASTTTAARPATGRTAAAAALTVVPVALVAWTAQVWAHRLPDPLPTHWRDLSRPDGFTPYAHTWQTLVVVAAVGAVIGLAALVLAWVNPLFQRATAGFGAALGYGALGLWLATVRAAWDRADAHGAALGWGLALPMVAAALAVLAVLLVLGRRPHTVQPVRPGAESSSHRVLAPGERAVWADRRFVVWPLLIAAVLAIASVAIGLTASALAAVILAAAALSVAVLAWVQVTVDERGLRLGLGPWAWTVKKVPLVAIAAASAETIDPGHWGGWGYRVLPGRSALVLGAGPAIVLDLTDGRRFAVTVADPAPAVALVRALQARAGS